MTAILINKVISLGSMCFSAQWIKNNDYKKESYPFDWIFSNLDMCVDCINDNFHCFLDKKYHYEVKIRRPVRSGHTIYDKYFCTHIFNHHNIVKDYGYFERCVERFKSLYNDKNPKLFINFNHSCDNDVTQEYINKLKLIEELLHQKTTNFYVLYIHGYKKSSDTHHTITSVSERVFILNFWPISDCNGRIYTNERDNEYLTKIIHNIFKFDIKNSSKF